MAHSFKSLAANSKETGVKKDDIFKVPPEQLKEEPGFNERDYSDPRVIQKIEDFAHAYASGAFVPPLVIRIDALTGDLIIVEGHQRRRGALLAISRGATLPHLVCVPFRGNDRDRVMVQLSSQDGLKLTAVGVARNYLKLIRMGMTEEEIAAERNKSPVHIRDMLVLAEASSDVQRMVNDDSVGATLAIEVIRQYGEGAGEYLRAKLDEAQKAGKTKITPSAVREWFPPRKIIGGIYSSVNSVVSTFDAKKRRELAELEKLDPRQLKGRKIEVDAGVILELYRSWASADEARRSKEEAATVAKQRKSQQSIPGTDD